MSANKPNKCTISSGKHEGGTARQVGEKWKICTSRFLDKCISWLIHPGGVTGMHGEGGTIDGRWRRKLEIRIHHRIVGTPDDQTCNFHSSIPPLIFFHPLSKACVEAGIFSSGRPQTPQCWPNLDKTPDRMGDPPRLSVCRNAQDVIIKLAAPTVLIVPSRLWGSRWPQDPPTHANVASVSCTNRGPRGTTPGPTFKSFVIVVSLQG